MGQCLGRLDFEQLHAFFLLLDNNHDRLRSRGKSASALKVGDGAKHFIEELALSFAELANFLSSLTSKLDDNGWSGCG